MQKKNQSNAWVVKRIKHNHQKYYELQNKKNETIIESLANIDKIMKEMQNTLSVSLKQTNDNLMEKLEKKQRETVEAIQSLHEDMNQTQELIKILAANQLIDQI